MESVKFIDFLKVCKSGVFKALSLVLIHRNDRRLYNKDLQRFLLVQLPVKHNIQCLKPGLHISRKHMVTDTFFKFFTYALVFK